MAALVHCVVFRIDFNSSRTLSSKSDCIFPIPRQIQDYRRLPRFKRSIRPKGTTTDPKHYPGSPDRICLPIAAEIHAWLRLQRLIAIRHAAVISRLADRHVPAGSIASATMIGDEAVVHPAGRSNSRSIILSITCSAMSEAALNACPSSEERNLPKRGAFEGSRSSGMYD